MEDLEEDAKPEDLMLSYVSGDKSKVRRRGARRAAACCACTLPCRQLLTVRS